MGTNVCIFEGRLTKDSEFTVFGQKDTPKLKFSLANNYGYGEYKKVNYIDCEIIGKKAESLAQYMVRGKAVNIVTEYHQQRWEDQDGNKKSKPLFHVLDVSFTSGSKDSENSSNTYQNNTQNRQETAKTGSPVNNTKEVNPFQAALAASRSKEASAQNTNLPSGEEFDDDIPF